MINVKAELEIPKWILEVINEKRLYKTDEDKMKVAIQISRLNIVHKTGGPFSAVIFNENNGRIISVGVNCVVDQICSIAHAEILAIIFAQKKIGRFKLDDSTYTIASSSQPCLMCLGALIWSGIKKIIFGATKEDIENVLGFDEGPNISSWTKELKKRDIYVKSNILRSSACDVLKLYKKMNGIIY